MNTVDTLYVCVDSGDLTYRLTYLYNSDVRSYTKYKQIKHYKCFLLGTHTCYIIKMVLLKQTKHMVHYHKWFSGNKPNTWYIS